MGDALIVRRGGSMQSDANLLPANIKNGVTIYDVTGTLEEKLPNGRVWTSCSGTYSYTSTFIYYAKGIWIASRVQEVSRSTGTTYTYKGLYYSTNGITWYQSNKTGGNFTTIYYANGRFVAGGSVGLWYSNNGKTWYQSNNTNTCYVVYHAKGIWVASVTDGLYYSTDGITWIQSNLTSGMYSSIYYADGTFVAGNAMQGGSYGVWWSTDGINWTQSNASNGTNDAILYADGFWVMGSNKYQYFGAWWSTDGKTWTQGNLPNFPGGKVLCYYNGVWIYSKYYSTDGKTWVGNSSNAVNSMSAILNANGILVACGSYGIWWSTDGINWTQSNVEDSVSIIRCANGIWVAGGYYGIWWSTDGKTWTQSNRTSSHLLNILCANGIWVAGLQKSALIYSLSGK